LADKKYPHPSAHTNTTWTQISSLILHVFLWLSSIIFFYIPHECWQWKWKSNFGVRNILVEHRSVGWVNKNKSWKKVGMAVQHAFLFIKSKVWLILLLYTSSSPASSDRLYYEAELASALRLKHGCISWKETGYKYYNAYKNLYRQ
jgi:hypothetical protein